jgi:hypothetical protein
MFSYVSLVAPQINNFELTTETQGYSRGGAISGAEPPPDISTMTGHRFVISTKDFYGGGIPPVIWQDGQLG